MNKNKLKEELVDLRMKLAEAENQALKIIDQFPDVVYYWQLARRAYKDIKEADSKLCELAELLGLDKLGLVKPERIN